MGKRQNGVIFTLGLENFGEGQAKDYYNHKFVKLFKEYSVKQSPCPYFCDLPEAEFTNRWVNLRTKDHIYMKPKRAMCGGWGSP